MVTHHNLRVAREAHALVLRIYRETEPWPQRIDRTLGHQLRKSALSVASNIAEGAGSGSKKNFARYVKIAIGSANETEYQLAVARDLGAFTEDQSSEMATQVRSVRKMLVGLHHRLDSS